MIRRALILAIRVYQLTLASVLGGQCRFEPSCSHYASEAIERHGAMRGSLLGVAYAEAFTQHPGHAYPQSDLLCEILGDS